MGLTGILRSSGLDVVAAYDNAVDLTDASTKPAPDIRLREDPLPPTPRRGHARGGCRAFGSTIPACPYSCSRSMSSWDWRQLLAESAEGVGYLLKDRISDVAEFVDAVRRVAHGGSAIDPTIVSTLLQRRRADDPLPVCRRESARCSS